MAALAYAWLVRLRVYFLASVAMVVTPIATSAWPWLARARHAAPGLDYIFIGLASLALGLAVSFAKAGFWNAAIRSLRKRTLDPSAAVEAPPPAG